MAGRPGVTNGHDGQKLPGFWASPVSGGLRPRFQPEFGIARATANEAVQKLRKQGNVITVPGAGPYLRKRCGAPDLGGLRCRP